GARHAHTVFDRTTVEAWVTHHLHTNTYRSWFSYIRDFGRWLRIQGHDTAYVLSDQWKARFVWSQPYLFSGGQIDRFFTAATQLSVQSPWQWQAAAFFGLMHCCGLRTPEKPATWKPHTSTGLQATWILLLPKTTAAGDSQSP